MAEITLTAAFSTVPAPEQEAIKRLLTETIEQLAQEDRSFSRARVVFTESDERCGLTAELDGVKKEGVPLAIELDILEDAQTSAGARAQLKEALRLYFLGTHYRHPLEFADEKTVLTLRDLTPQGVIKLSLGKKRHVLLKPV